MGNNRHVVVGRLAPPTVKFWAARSQQTINTLSEARLLKVAVRCPEYYTRRGAQGFTECKMRGNKPYLAINAIGVDWGIAGHFSYILSFFGTQPRIIFRPSHTTCQNAPNERH